MTISSYSDLQTEVIRNSNRSDLSNDVPTFIQLCESEMQRRLKLVDFDSTATVTVTAGVGSLPSDFAGFRAAVWDGDTQRTLTYITPDRFNALPNRVTVPTFYTVVGSQLKVMSEDDGTVTLTYQARFTPLSSTNATNAIITTYPDAYYFGTLWQLYHFLRNWETAGQHKARYEEVVNQIIRDHKERKYPGPLEVRPR